MNTHRSPVLPSGKYSFCEAVPEVDASAWIAPTAAVIGDVTVGAGTGIWFGAVVRGDFNAISIGRNTNIQDNAVVHVTAGPCAVSIGDDVTVGHGAILHGCTLMNRAFVGMGSIVLDGAVIESNGMLAAGALLTSGKTIGPGELWAGSPAKLLRPLGDDEISFIGHSARHYAEYARRFADSLSAV